MCSWLLCMHLSPHVSVCLCFSLCDSVRCVTAPWVIWKPETACGSTNAWCTARTASESPEVKRKNNKKLSLWICKCCYTRYNVTGNILFSTDKWRRWVSPEPSMDTFKSQLMNTFWVTLILRYFGFDKWSDLGGLTNDSCIGLTLTFLGLCTQYCS